MTEDTRITLAQMQANLERATTYDNLRLTQEVLRDVLSHLILINATLEKLAPPSPSISRQKGK